MCATLFSLRGVIASGHVPQDFVRFLVDATLVPAFEGALQEDEEGLADCLPLACRRKSNAPHRERMVQTASPVHCCNLGVPAAVPHFATPACASHWPTHPSPTKLGTTRHGSRTGTH